MVGGNLSIDFVLFLIYNLTLVKEIAPWESTQLVNKIIKNNDCELKLQKKTIIEEHDFNFDDNTRGGSRVDGWLYVAQTPQPRPLERLADLYFGTLRETNLEKRWPLERHFLKP